MNYVEIVEKEGLFIYRYNKYCHCYKIGLCRFDLTKLVFAEQDLDAVFADRSVLCDLHKRSSYSEIINYSTKYGSDYLKG